MANKEKYKDRKVETKTILLTMRIGHYKEKTNLSYIPREYKGYLDLFKKIEKDNTTLLPHQSWDHEINLVEGKEVLFGPIYQMLKEELETLRDFIDIFIKRGWIQESTSLV